MKSEALIYKTSMGEAYCSDALYCLKKIRSSSVNLVITSPPFPLQRKKEYGNESEENYLNWFLPFAAEIKRVLKDEGSFVIDLGGVYKKGLPVRSLYNFKLLIMLCEEFDFNLAQDFYWYNPSRLPSPIEWVNKRKIRAKDSVNTVWWLSKTPWPKADVAKVRVAYSERMKKLLKAPNDYYSPADRPSGHQIKKGFHTDNGGALPSNLMSIANTESNGQYTSGCKEAAVARHPARFPEKLPAFFVDMLTNENDLVIDPFAGSNTVGYVAESKKRNWKAFELNREYISASIFRFIDYKKEGSKKLFFEAKMKGGVEI